MNQYKKFIMMANQMVDDKPSLPKEYVELEYIESPSVNGYGRCIIKTQLTYRNIIIHATIQGNTSQANPYTIAFGGFQDNVPMTLLAYKDDSYGYSLYKVDYGSGISINEKVDVTLTIEVNPDVEPVDNKYACIGTMQIGNIVKTYKSTKLFANNILFLFSGGSSAATNPWNFIGKLFRCKITDLQGNILRYYIPALRIADSTPGMYDLVTGQFFTNQGTGEFLYKIASSIDDTKEAVNTILQSIVDGNSIDNMDKLLDIVSYNESQLISVNSKLEEIINT